MRWRNLFLKVFSLGFLILCPILGFSENPDFIAVFRSIIFGYLVFILFRTAFFFYAAFREKVRDLLLDMRNQDEFHRPLVTIIVPAYNEETDLAQALESILDIDYPNYEILVVDDGSTDNTYGIAQHMACLSQNATVKVIHQPNGGKARALNNGIQHATGDLVMCVDSDSKLSPQSLMQAVRHFEDPKVGAVAGFIEIGNQSNILLRLQQLEYLVGLNFTRRALSFMGVVPIVPGPAGMFRRKALLEAGGFVTDDKLFAEDAELSLRLLSHGWEVHSEEDMIATTEAPEDIRSLLRQRYRWNRGTYQALKRNLSSLFHDNGLRGKWVGAYLWGETVITPFLNMGLILYFFSYFYATGHLQIFTIWYFYLLCLDLLTTILVTHRHGNILRWVVLTVVNKFFYYYMLLTWRLICLHEEWDEKHMTWDKLERTGHMEAEAS